MSGEKIIGKGVNSVVKKMMKDGSNPCQSLSIKTYKNVITLIMESNHTTTVELGLSYG